MLLMDNQDSEIKIPGQTSTVMETTASSKSPPQVQSGTDHSTLLSRTFLHCTDITLHFTFTFFTLVAVKVLIYNGQLDVIIPYPATENFINKLQWKGAKEYATAPRRIWKVRGEVAGYAREVRKFRQVMVRNAGHILPYDQPVYAFDMIMRFIEGKSFDSSP